MTPDFASDRALPSDQKEQNVTFHILKSVMDILPAHLGTFYLYADNYYGSLEIAEEAAARKFCFTFGCRSKRPAKLFKNGIDNYLEEFQGLEKFGAMLNAEGTIAAVTWEDKNMTRFLSNIYSNSVVTSTQRVKGKMQKKRMPKLAYDYTVKGMGHVDQFNAKLIVEPHHRNFSWRRTHFLTILRIVLVNTWIYWRSINRLGRVRIYIPRSVKDWSDYLEAKDKKELKEFIVQFVQTEEMVL
jgi:hypothetical protein